MKIGIIGYKGKMGVLIEQVALIKGHEITKKIDFNEGAIDNNNVDCYIDFSTAPALEKNLEAICKAKVPIVIGTTGWYDKKQEYHKIFKENNIKAIWGSNFSLGVNIFMNVLENSSKLIFNNFMKEYDVFTNEIHHNQKIDSPSGTAIKIAELLRDGLDNKNKLVYDKLDRKIEGNEIHVSSTRGGYVPGTHSVFFDSDFDTIELKHTARKRNGFALGSVYAAEIINTKAEYGLNDFYTLFKSNN